MVQVILQVLIVGMLTGLVGIIWMVARNSFTDDHDPDDNRHGETSSAEPHDREEPHERSSRQSTAEVGVLAVHK